MTDNDLVLSNAQAVTATADSTNTLDLGALVDDRGTALTNFGSKDGKISLQVGIGTTFAGGTSIAFKLQDSADDSTFADTELETDAIVTATLVAGYEAINVPLPQNLRRYIKMVYTVVGTMTAGKINAHLVMGVQASG